MNTTHKEPQEDPQASLDDLIWLEASHDPNAIDWGKERTRRSIERLGQFASYEQVEQELAQTLGSAIPQPAIVLLGGRAVRFLVTDAQPYGQLQVAERDACGVPGMWRTALDIAQLRKNSGVPYELEYWFLDEGYCLPPDYNRCLLRLSHGGSDAVEIREFDLDEGEFVEGGFDVPKSIAWVQWLNRDLVLVGHTMSGPRTMAGHPAAFQLWRRGQSLRDAPIVYEAKSTDVFVFIRAAGSGASRYGIIMRTIDHLTSEMWLVYQDGRIGKVELPGKDLKSCAMLVELSAGSRALFVQLIRDAEIAGKRYPKNTVLSYAVDPTVPIKKRVSAVCTLGADEYMDGPHAATLVAARDWVAFVVNCHLVQKVMLATLRDESWCVRQLMQVEAGQAITGLVADAQSNDLVVTVSGFVTPSRQVLYRSGASPRLLAEDPVRFDGSNYITEIRSTRSKDGTEIDYFLLKPRVSPWTGAQPLLVTGYAAFGISVAPSYFGDSVGGPAFKLWLDRGGSLIIPAARGGGERGEEWHRAAMVEGRQNSYDDFIAVIQRLVDGGFTDCSRIGVFGMSNGGLLAAVLGTQRPDLIGAVVSDVPLTDLVRMKYMGKGPSWLGEYGDSADPEMASILESYSPLQNVKAGVKYPPFFVSTSTEDDRTGPGHARKLVARLESVGSTVYFCEQTEGGHGVSDAFRNRELMVMRMTFLIESLMKGPATKNGRQKDGLNLTTVTT